MFTIQDSQGHTIGVFDNLAKAKHEMIEWAWQICDAPYLVDVSCPESNNLFVVHEDGNRAVDPLMDGFTIKKWIPNMVE